MINHEVSMSYARLRCLKSTCFRFTEPADGHFISKEDTKFLDS
jgi:hypothetical protein